MTDLAASYLNKARIARRIKAKAIAEQHEMWSGKGRPVGPGRALEKIAKPLETGLAYGSDTHLTPAA